MKIAVIVKRVPDTETKVKVGADGKGLDPAGVNFILNPYDEFAIEEALLLKEKHGGEVVVLSVGSSDSTKEMRTALAMGADSGILLKSAPEFDDIAGVVEPLAARLRELAPDLILCGKQAVDDDTWALAPWLAEALELPCATVVVKLDIEGTNATAEREIEGGREKLAFSLPAVVSCQKGLNTPRYASMKGIMMAKKKNIDEVDVTLGARSTSVTGLELPPARAEGKIVGEGPEAVDALIAALRNDAKVI